MRHVVHALSFILLASVSTVPASAQEAEVVPEPNVLQVPDYGTQWSTVVASNKPASPTGSQSIVLLCTNHMAAWPEELAKACQDLIADAIQADRQTRQAQVSLNDAQFHLKHMQATLRGQRREGAWVFWMVVAITGVGLVAAVAQFLRGLHAADSGGSVEVAVSNNELKFKTTWLGALLLGMSMGFMLIYLFFVYPVRYVGS